MLVWCTKAELLQEGIIFLIHLFARAILLMKKLKIEESKATYNSTFKTDIIKLGLVFSISNFFINKIALANIWMSFSCSNLALNKIQQKFWPQCAIQRIERKLKLELELQFRLQHFECTNLVKLRE